MSYRIAVTRADYSDLASARVFRSAPGYPAFLVRLAQEMFGRSQLAAIPPEPPHDLVLTDAPYGVQTTWSGSVLSAGNPLPALFGTLGAVLPGHALIVLTALT